MKRQSVITVNKNVMSGMPVLRGTRIPVNTLVGRFLKGDSLNYIANDYDISRQLLEKLIAEVREKSKKPNVTGRRHG